LVTSPREKIKNKSHRDLRGHRGKKLGALGVLRGKKLYFIYHEKTETLLSGKKAHFLY
jgi:hypothetical protein